MTNPAPTSYAEIAAIFAQFRPASQAAIAASQAHQDRLTKPQGALGRLEEIAIWLAAWQNPADQQLGTPRGGKTHTQIQPPHCDHPRTAIFVGNHGIAARGVSAYPSEVTVQMVANFQNGGAAINQICKAFDCDLRVYEMNLAVPTGDISVTVAMDESEAMTALAYGMMAVEPGVDILCIGEMGIGNSTVAAALCLAQFGGAAEDWVGAGTGVVGAQWQKKCQLVSTAVERHRSISHPLARLAALGGREFCAIVGAIIAARIARVPVLLDGFATTSAAATLFALDPHFLDHCLVAHQSAEPGHRRLNQALGKRPLLDLDMRLGEASGATLALGLVRAAVACHNGMASFAAAAVSERI